jgi:hypothetical protein
MIAGWALGAAACAGDVPCWKVDDVRAGMSGYGWTVVSGVAPARFEAKILGVLRDVAPGRDMIVARFSGLGLEKSGIAAGMSGSPVYIDDKLLGAVAYTWEFGVEPIGGVTPFCQMRELADAGGLRDKLADSDVSFTPPFWPPDDDAPIRPGRLLPIRTPLAVAGMSSTALRELSKNLEPWGLIPVQGGAANPDVKSAHAGVKIGPGSAVAVGLVTGDVAATAVGTVTAVDDGRVYAFGHPFLELGRCRLPLLSAYIHTVLPLQSASFKVGSSLERVGTVDADVSTGVAAELGGEAAFVPVSVRVERVAAGRPREFRFQIAPVPHLLSSLLSASTISCIEGDGKTPLDFVVHLKAEIRIAGKPPLVLEDVYSGERYQGPPGLVQALAPLANLVGAVASNPFEPATVESIDCEVAVSDRRRSAAIVNAWIRPAEPIPGETATVFVEVRPYRPDSAEADGEQTQTLPLKIQLPRSLPPGEYAALVGDARSDFEKESRRRAHLARPANFDQFLRALAAQLAVRQTDLAVRIDTNDVGAAVDGVVLPDLPTGWAEVLASNRAQAVDRWPSSLLATRPTPWVVEGSKSVRFHVVEQRKTLGETP